MPNLKNVNTDKPWLNADGSMKSDEELKSICQTWKPSQWEEYLSTIEGAQVEMPISQLTADDEKERAQELAVNIFDYIIESKNVHLKSVISEAISSLTPRQLQVVRKVYWERKSYAQAAKELGVGKSTIQNIHIQALGRLRTIVPDLTIKKRTINTKAS